MTHREALEHGINTGCYKTFSQALEQLARHAKETNSSQAKQLLLKVHNEITNGASERILAGRLCPTQVVITQINFKRFIGLQAKKRSNV